ncbi:DUF2938 domain-containing protein [Pseudoruegeria sp. HB172150]|uniref:DUF2938 domain-containing protein n=1 Tax=Pseudoruegeria sp. HB172150 TaxID=2721164 RepID=UPI0015517077|nr:DUF2938 domain-containing protein [Pseudoruegeria sp. HB172150]
MHVIMTGIVMGLAGTAAMDLWAILLARVAGQPKPNWAMPGRWLGHVFRGKLFHDDIATAEPVAGELRLGWALHYGVGVLYGLVFAVAAGPDWLAAPSFLPVWLYSLATIAAGWFLLQPGMGLGWAAAKTPNPWKVRGMGLVAHTVFGLGMWVGAVLVG